MGVRPNQVLCLSDMVRTDRVICSITGITKGDLVEGITHHNQSLVSETLLICGQTKNIRRIKTAHGTHPI
jgi:fructose-1,6-bisphosphatase II